MLLTSSFTLVSRTALVIFTRFYRRNTKQKYLAGVSHRLAAFQEPAGTQNFEDIDELEDEDDFASLDKKYDEHKNELEWKRHIGSIKNIERKHFKKEVQPNLLTWAAKEQIRYLHFTNSEEWPIERLAEGFQVTTTVIKSILKSKYVPKNIEKHDKAVLNRWKKRGYPDGPVYKLNKTNAFIEATAGIETQSVSVEPTKKAIGKFQSIYTDYVAKIKSSDKETTELSLVSDTDDSKKVSLIHSEEEHHKSQHMPMTFDEFITSAKQENKAQNQRNQGRKERELVKGDEFGSINTETTSPVNVKEVLAEDKIITKYKEETEEFIIDKGQSGNFEAYQFDNIRGYQRPWGWGTPAPDKIHIKHFRKDAVYKRGDSYYDENGDFMYRVLLPTS